MQIYNDIEPITVSEQENFTKIEIGKNCSLMYLYNELNKKLPPKKFCTININDIISSNNLEKKTIYLINHNNQVYNIITNGNLNGNFICNYPTTNKEKLIISEKTYINDEIIEISIEFLPDNNYTIKVKENYSNGITKNILIYNKNGQDDISKSRRLSKKDALNSAQILLANLKRIKNIDKIINIDLIYNYLNIISNKAFNNTISDDAITLSKDYDYKQAEYFYIILNKTKEIIGSICFDINDGNINYEINKQYQNKHFTLRALNLLKEYINATYKDKSPYFAVESTKHKNK